MYLVLGDSHSRVFRCRKEFDVFDIPGATAQGMVNPNSKTNALSRFRNILNTVDTHKYSKLLIMLGEVDVGFVIWYRSEKHNISIEEQLKTSIQNLMHFIDRDVVQYFSRKNIIVLGANLPTIRVPRISSNPGLRKEITASFEERTQKTYEYNYRLYQTCMDHNVNYCDINRETSNADGTVNQYYVYDHHLDENKTIDLWINTLNIIS